MLVPGILTYCASKAACHFLTVSLREELKNTNISIAGAYPGYIDTKMVEDIVADKVSPKYAAEKMLEQLTNGEKNIFPDPMSQRYRPLLNLDPPILKV